MAAEPLSNRKMASSFAWSSLENGGAQLAQITVFFIAARILAPEDIGRASLALVIVQAFQTMVCASINGYVVSAAQDQRHAATTAAHHLALALGALQCVVVLMADTCFVALGGNVHIAGLFMVPAVTNMVIALGIAHQAWLARTLAMRALATRTLVSVVVAGCCGITMALLKFGAYAIVFQALIQAVIGTALLWAFSPWRPVSRVTRAQYQQIIAFTRHLFLTGALNFAVGNIDLVIVGAFLGVRAAGTYAVARRALSAANGLITTALYQVSLSIFSRLQGSAQELEKRFLVIIASTSLITVPVFFAAIGLARPLVQLLFGAKWIEAVPIMMVLMPAGALQSLGIYNQTFTVARGRPDLQSRLALANAGVSIPVMIIAAQFSALGVAIGYTLASYLIYPASIALVVRSSSITTRRYLGAIAPAFVCGAIVATLIYVTQFLAGPTPLVKLIAAAAVGGASYIAVTAVVARTTVSHALQLVMNAGTASTAPLSLAPQLEATDETPISVVIPLYDKRDQIARTIESVLRQTHRNFNVIVVDDGSTDGSAEIVAAFADARIQLVHQHNQGAAAARNTGWQMARHPHIAFLDADDQWDYDYLSAIACLIGDFPDCAAFATSYRRRSSTRVVQTRVHPGLVRAGRCVIANYFVAATKGDQPFYTSTICIRRDVLAQLGGFKRGVSHGEDLDLWGRIALHHAIAFDPAPKATYRIDAANRAMHKCPPLGWAFRASVREYRAQNPVVALPAGLDRHVEHIELYHAALNLQFTSGEAIRNALRAIPWLHFPLRKSRIWAASLFVSMRHWRMIRTIARALILTSIAGASMAPRPAEPGLTGASPAVWFAARSPWNTRIGNAAVMDYSAPAMQAYLARGHAINMNWGSAGVYVIYAGPASQTASDLAFAGGDGTGWRIPAVPISRELITAATYRLAQHNTDGMTCVVDMRQKRFLSFWQPRPSAHGIAITTGGSTPFSGIGWSNIGPRLPSLGRAAGANYCGGLIREAEMRSGVIGHALALAWTRDLVRALRSPFGAVQYPARFSDGSNMTSPATIPMGARIQLDPSLSDAALVSLGLSRPADLIIAHALQQYGGYVVDSNTPTMGGSIYFESRQTNAGAVYAATNPWPMAVIARMRFVAPPAPLPLDTQAPDIAGTQPR